MYKLLLTLRYLRRKLIALFALLGVTLCTAMVIIVISIMGGFLDMVRDAGKTQMGDVTLAAGLAGFPHYEDLIDQIEALPETKAAAPLIGAYGLLKLPGEVIKPVEVFGIKPESQEQVTQYKQTLFWDEGKLEENPYVEEQYGPADPTEAAMEMRSPWRGVTEVGPEGEEQPMPAVVPGVELSPYNVRTQTGEYQFSPSILGTQLTLTVLPITTRGGVLEPSVRRLAVVNEFHSGLYDVDSRRVYIPFDVAQQMMQMQATQRVDVSPTGEIEVLGEVPGRATEIQVRAKAGVSSDQLRDAIAAMYDQFAERYEDMPPQPFMAIRTWQERQMSYLQAVEHEKGLMTVLFGIISLVAVVMVAVIFYMIVLEKTRDIGILRSVGASRPGVASIFLIYGAALGTIGAILGTTAAWLIVRYINEIHEWLGATLDIVIWDRSVYFFDRIPSHVDWNEVTVIALVAIVASMLGALVPAIVAARVDPVKALQYE